MPIHISLTKAFDSTKSRISKRFVQSSSKMKLKFMKRKLDDDYPIAMIDEEMQTYIDFEDTQGYRLADIIPLTAFSPDKPGPGSIGVSLVFERRGGEGTDISLDKWSLKDNREESVSVPCPVLGCKHSVDRMTKKDTNLNSDNYLFPDHRIYIYITLTRSEQDKDLLCKVKKVVKNPQTLIHINWGQVEKFLSGISLQGKAKAERRILTRYLYGKTAGYSEQQMKHLLD